MKSRQALGTALVVCTADRPAETRRRVLDQFGDDELAQLAQHAAWHRVVPFLAAAVRTSGVAVSEEAVASLERTHATRTAAHMRVLADLDAVAASLSAGAVRFLVVKGPVLSEHLYPSPDLRTYEDLDLLIPPGSFEHAVDALRASGSVLLDRNWSLTRADTRGQLHFQLPMGTLADVHWHLLNRENVRDGFSITTDDLFERSREVVVAGRSVPTLDPVDTLLHVALHAALSGGDRLIWLKDIERAIAVDRPAWDDVIQRARAWKAGRSIAITLNRARRSLGAPVPDDSLGALFASPLWQGLSDRLDRRSPTERSVGRESPAVFWAQLTRDSGVATARAVLHRASRRLRAMAHGGSSPGAIFTSSGTEEDQRTFLQRVASEDSRSGGTEKDAQ
jgi:Uncharacterised nucleotidyltransferase